MPRFIGYDPTANASLTGVWDATAQYEQRILNNWPTTAGVRHLDFKIVSGADYQYVSNSQGNFYIFSANGTYNLLKNYVGAEIFYIAGGGGTGTPLGGGQPPGGGGAGGYYSNTNINLPSGNYTMEIGVGGQNIEAGPTSLSNPGSNTFITSPAPVQPHLPPRRGGGGGGIGGSPIYKNGQAGGSGGGGGGYPGPGGTDVTSGGANTAGQGHAGGAGQNDNGGQGGGAGNGGQSGAVGFPSSSNPDNTFIPAATQNGATYRGTILGVGGFGGERPENVSGITYYGSGAPGILNLTPGTGGVPGIVIIRVP